jgi:dTDP-4-dehydrorhamnose 3,5-epimerase
MVFIDTGLPGAYVVDLEKHEDERGFFARSWCEREAEANALIPRFVQCNVSFNKLKGTLRGLHYQLPPYAEAKLVRCTRGAIYDVIVDLRAESATFLQWFAVELTANNHKMLYIPKRFAHGFQTLEDQTEVFYQMSDFYVPEAASGIRWDDVRVAVRWPHEVTAISAKDRQYQDFHEGMV